MSELLEVRELTVELPTAAGWVRPVNEVWLRVGAGEALGLVGESGSGKTMLSLALMGLLPAGARVRGEARLAGEEEERVAAIVGGGAKGGASPAPTTEAGPALITNAGPALIAKGGLAPPIEVVSARTTGTGPAPAGKLSLLDGRNLTALSERKWREVRGGEIAMVFQEPMTSLNPVMRIGAQIEEAIRAHDERISASEVKSRALESLRRAAVPEVEARFEQFPHQLSGGLRQRAMIAMALAGGPRLLIADEPTTALDVTVQKQILELLDGLRRELKLGLLFITHDLGVVAQVAERIAVMYAGRIVEQGRTREVLSAPRHPYTQGLLRASPTLERGKLTPIPGIVPQLTALPPGCAFEPRCALRRDECIAGVPAFRSAGAEHEARCVLI
jgi:peptide/nickel transport system ATP-binding protein